MPLPLAPLLAIVLLQPVLQQSVPTLPDAAYVARFARVDDRLYRGAQPDAKGFRHLRDIGVRTVINLREAKDAIRLDEQRTVESLGMRYVSLPVKDNNFFTQSRTIPEETVKEFFRLVDSGPGPVFVHCRRGADRTGTLVALYRIARHGWENRRALEEARETGLRSWYTGMKRQILAFRGSSVSADAVAGRDPLP